MSLRIDATEWISGALLIGETGLGVLAENIPSTGTSGASYLYNDLSLPADNGKEICGRITSWPSAGTLYAYEDGSFSFTGAPDGAYSFAYQLYVDGVATGSPTTVDLTVGVLTLRPGLFTNANTFFAPTVALASGPQTLTPGLLTNANTFYSPVVNLDGAQTLVPALFTNDNTFYGPTVALASGPQTLTPALFTNTSVFFPATITGGEVVIGTLDADRFDYRRALRIPNAYAPDPAIARMGQRMTRRNRW